MFLPPDARLEPHDGFPRLGNLTALRSSLGPERLPVIEMDRIRH